VQRAAADQFAVEFGDPEFLDRLVERHEVFLEQDLAGVDVDECFHGRDVGRAGTPDDNPLRRSSHTCEGNCLGNRYSVAVSGQPDIDPVVPRARVANIANMLTGVRMVLVPVFLVLLFVGDGHETFWRIAAFIVFAVAVITDRLDGALARSYGMVTEFGKLADPIADKALIGAALIGLSMLGDVPWWVTTVIMVREIGITALRFAVLRHGVIPASRGGKLKTLVQGVAIGLFVLPLSGPWLTGAWVVMWAAVALTVLTGADYVVSAVKDSRGRPAGH
jgi:CDP-diacylglycerol--glycerol-3-phosphate 3-phosphatidyltransferase